MKITNAPIRSKSKGKNKDYRLVMKKDLYDRLETVAYSNDVSVADFIRESVKRNITAYEKLQAVLITFKRFMLLRGF